MRLTEEQRAFCAERVAAEMIDVIRPGTRLSLPHGLAPDDGDIAAIGSLAAVAVAVSIAATSCVDASAAIALVRNLAEAVAAEIYGPTP